MPLSPGILRWCRVVTDRFGLVLVRTSSTCSRATIFLREVISVVLVCLRPCLNPSLRGRPRTVGLRPRSGARSPDTDKIYAIVPRDSSPLHNQFHAWPEGPGPGDISSWHGAAGIRTPEGGESTPSQKSNAFSVLGLGVLCFMCLTRRIGQRWEPTRAPRQGSKRNEGGPSGSPLFFACVRHDAQRHD